MDYYHKPEISGVPTKEEFSSFDIGGLGAHPLSPEYEEEQEEIRIARFEKFLKAHPDFRQRVISDFEERVSILESKIRDGKAELSLMLKILKPTTHMSAKLEEHGPLLGILPAALYTVLTPLLVGIPNAIIMAPREVFKIMKNEKELEELINGSNSDVEPQLEIDGNAFLSGVGAVKQEIDNLEGLLAAHEV